MPAPGPWIAQAACAGEPTDLFFPDDSSGLEMAKSICSRCPVRKECVCYGLAIPSLPGVRGGLTEAERQRLRPRHGLEPRTGPSKRCSQRSGSGSKVIVTPSP
jgi:WhiB family redox-sensing transcriptional regulator